MRERVRESERERKREKERGAYDCAVDRFSEECHAEMCTGRG